MALNDIDEIERKRKEATTEFQSAVNAENVNRDIRQIPTSLNELHKVDPEKNVITSVRTPDTPTKLAQIDHGKVTNMAPGRLAELASMKNPTINEIPNARRDSELGKMNVMAKGDTTTYDVGGNTLGYKLSDNDKQLKTNLEKINQMVASGTEVSPEQINRINALRQEAGYLRGGTDRRPVGPDGLPLRQESGLRKIGNMNVQFSPETSLKEINRFNEIPVQSTPTWNDLALQDRNRQSSEQGQNASQNADRILGLNKNTRAEGELFTKENSPDMGWMERKELNQQLLANQQSGNNVLAQIGSQQNIDRNKSTIDKETNRINELNIIGQNKLRDIQGQVAKAPPIKEQDDLYSTVDTYDELGQKTGQKIYNKRTGEIMNQNQSFATPKPATVEKLLKMRNSKDPNLSAAEAEYKMRFGSLPY